MKIIQVIDLDGTTVKVDETNPSEPKIVSALQFDLAMRKNVAIGDIAGLVFAKPTNANVEAVCIGYKDTDGKYYGISGGNEESIFAPKKVTRKALFSLYVGDGIDYMTIKVRTAGSDYNNSGNEELLTNAGAKVTEPFYVRLGNDTKMYRFEPQGYDSDEQIYTLRSTEAYAGTTPSGSLHIDVGLSDDVNTSDGVAQTTLDQVSNTTFEIGRANASNTIRSYFGPADRL